MAIDAGASVVCVTHDPRLIEHRPGSSGWMTAPCAPARLGAVNPQDHDDSQPARGASLVDTYLARRPDLVRFFTLRLRSATAAEDLVQDIYLRLSALDPGAEIHNPVGYLYRLGSNLMLDRLRGERRAAVREGAWLDSHSTRMGSEEISEARAPSGP